MNFSRRAFFRGAAAVGVAGALPTQAAAPIRKAVAIIVFPGGFNALHVTPNTLGGTFGTSAESMVQLPSGLVVDKATFGGLPAAALRSMAVVGIDHGLTAHAPASSAMFTGAASYPLTLAAAMGSDAALRCAKFGDVPSTAFSPVPGASVTEVRDVRTAIDLFVGSNRPGEPSRAAMSRGLGLSYALSKPMLAQNPRTLLSHASGYETILNALGQPVRSIDWAGIASEYGLPAGSTDVSSNASRFAAAELAIRGGTPVVVIPVSADQRCGEAGWDTHGDESGQCARGMFAALATPHLARFLERTMAMTDTQVTTTVMGEFSRDPMLSDHARCLTAAVFGAAVKPGSTGPAFNRNGKLAMPDGTPGIAQYWALLAQLGGVTTKPFGDNPHPLVSG